MMETLLTQLAQKLALPVSETDRKRARLHLLDWLACVAGARDTEAGHLGGLISRLGWERATYVGNALGLEDVYAAAQIRPGCVVWPAAMSMSSANMDARLDAGVRGYEAMLVIGSALSGASKSLCSTAMVGAFGSCAAFGSLIGFAPVEYANALGNAGAVAGGLGSVDEGSLTRQWQVYHAVRTGRDAAMHVHHGATGPTDLLERDHGFLASFPSEERVLANADKSWLMDQVNFKLTASGTLETLPDASADQIAAKLQSLGKQGGISDDEADRVVDLALHGEDPGTIDAMLEDWLA